MLVETERGNFKNFVYRKEGKKYEHIIYLRIINWNCQYFNFVVYLEKNGIHSLEGYPLYGKAVQHSNGRCHGYLMKDLNGDGVEELIIGYMDNARLAGMYFNSFEALYTIENGKVVYVAGRENLDTDFHILYDGTFYKYGDSYPTVEVQHFKLQDGALVLLDSFEGKPNPIGNYFDDSVDMDWSKGPHPI